MEHKYIEYKNATKKVFLVIAKILLWLVIAVFLIFLVKWENVQACVALSAVFAVLHFAIAELTKSAKTFYLLNEEGIFAYDGVKTKWIYYDWTEVKSAYYRWAGKGAFLILSPHELNLKQVKKLAQGASNGASTIHNDGSIVLPCKRNDDNDTFKFIESKLDFVSDKWYDIFAEADNP